MGLFSKSSGKVKLLDPQGYNDAAKYLRDILSAGTPDFQPKGVAGLTDLQTTGIGTIEDYIGKGTAFSGAAGGVTPTLQGLAKGPGDISIDDLPGLRSIMEMALEEGQQGINRAGRMVQKEGMGASSTGARVLGKQAQQLPGIAAGSVLPALLQAWMTKTGQQLPAINQLLGIGGTKDAQTVQKGELGAKFGAIEQLINQAREDADFEAQRQMLLYPATYGAQIASTMYQNPSTYTKQSSSTGILDVAGAIGGMIAGFGALGSAGGAGAGGGMSGAAWESGGIGGLEKLTSLMT